MKSFSIPKVLFFIATTILFYALSFVARGVAFHFAAKNYTNPIFAFEFHLNTGAAFSLFKDATFLLAAIGLAILFYIVVYVCYNTWRLSYGLISLFGFLSAGIAANLFERVSKGYVTDYIKINLFDFPIFNFPDILIVVSCFALIFVYQFANARKKYLNKESNLKVQQNGNEHDDN